jgi:hypothetical protein
MSLAMKAVVNALDYVSQALLIFGVTWYVMGNTQWA